MCGLFGTVAFGKAGLLFLLVCPLMMIGMMAVAFLVGPRVMRCRRGRSR